MKQLLTGVLCTAMLLSSAMAAGPAMPISPKPYAVTVDGEALDLTGKAPYAEGGNIMVPLRAVAEALGYTITWTADRADAVNINNGAVNTWVYIGVDSYCRTSSTAPGMGAPQSFGAAPAAVNNTTFVPTGLFTLLGDEVAVEEGTVAFTAAGKTEIPNPMKRYESVEAAQAAAGVAFALPDMPAGYTLEGAFVIGGDLVHLVYTNGADEIRLRAARGGGDISGDYNAYAEVETVAIGGLQVTAKGAGGLIALCTWQNDGVSYALSLSAPAALEAVAAMLA